MYVCSTPMSTPAVSVWGHVLHNDNVAFGISGMHMKMLRNVKVNSSWSVWDYDNHAGRLGRMVRRYLSTVVTTT